MTTVTITLLVIAYVVLIGAMLIDKFDQDERDKEL